MTPGTDEALRGYRHRVLRRPAALALTLPLLLGVGVYPLILLSAALYNRAASRLEARYRSIARP